MAVKFFVFKFPGVSKARCAFQFRNLEEGELAGNISFNVGDSEKNVEAARQNLLSQLTGIEQWSECHQVHGTSVLKEPLPTEIAGGELPEADGMMTSKKGLGLMVKTADCQPLFVADETGSCVMALHVGWKGNRAGFPQLAIKEFCKQYNVLPEKLFAVRGPSLGPAAAEFINFDTEFGPDFAQWYDPQTKRMNLWALTRWQLQEAGLPAENIFCLDMCTHENYGAFFSWRKNRNTGRQASLVWIEK